MKKQMKYFIAAFAMVFSLAVVTQAGAIEFGVRAYMWAPDLKTSDAKSTTGGVDGSNINMKDMLGIGNKATYAVEAFGGVGRHHASFSYTPFGYTDNTVLSSNVNFNGVTYNAGTGVKSELAFSMFDLKYQFDLLNLENVLAGFSVGPMGQLKFSTGSFKMTAPGAGLDQNKSFNSVLPMVGVGAHIGLIAKLLEARCQVTGGGYSSGNYSVEALADVSVTPFPFVAVHGGYKMVKLKMDVNDYAMDSLFTGPYIALTVGF